MRAPEPEEWSPEGLCDHVAFIHRKAPDRRFAFILGAGASVQSGIPAAGALVWRWLGELHRRLARGGVPLERWATAEALGIPGFSLDRAPAFYSQVFARRFHLHPDEGYADLEDIMQGKDPSFGYSVLAHILAETRHKLVITTNFDNLVGEALSIFTGTAPLVCGHESLAAFIRVVPRRPVVVKIHRDLLMAPMNREDEIATLQSAWIDPLTRVFASYTPIVLGYGGNDGSLMNFLRNLAPGAIAGGIFWCYYGPGGPPGPDVRELVAHHRGALVPIEGFDELMLRLGAGLGVPLLDQVIETRARARVDNYRRRVEELRASLLAAPAEDDAAPAEDDAGPAEDDAGPAAAGEPSEPIAREQEAPLPVSSAIPVTTAPASTTPVPSDASRLDRAPTATPPVRSASPAPTAAPPVRSASPAPIPVRSPGPTRSAGPRERPTRQPGALRSAPPSPVAPGPIAAGLPPPPAGRASARPPADLLHALQQVTAGAADISPWSALMQARAEPERARRLELLRSALARFPGDAQLLRELAALGAPASPDDLP